MGAYAYDYEDVYEYEETCSVTEEAIAEDCCEQEEFDIDRKIASKIGFAVVAGMGAFITLLNPIIGIAIIVLGYRAVEW